MAEETTSQFGPEDEVQSGLFKFDKIGDAVEGVLIDVRTQVSKIDGSDQKMYEIQCANGEVKAVFGRKIIDQKMKLAKIGDLVKMVFTEEGKAKQGTQNKFKIIRVYLNSAPKLGVEDEVKGDDGY